MRPRYADWYCAGCGASVAREDIVVQVVANGRRVYGHVVPGAVPDLCGPINWNNDTLAREFANAVEGLDERGYP